MRSASGDGNRCGHRAAASWLRRDLEDDSAASCLAIGSVAAQRGSAVYVPGRVQNYARFGSEASCSSRDKGVEHSLLAQLIQLDDDAAGIVQATRRAARQCRTIQIANRVHN